MVDHGEMRKQVEALEHHADVASALMKRKAHQRVLLVYPSSLSSLSLARSGLALWNVFAQHTFVTFQPPGSIRTILKPLGDARLGMNLTVHHRNAGLVAVGDNLFEADLAVAQQCDEGNEHGISIQMIRWILPCSVRAKRRTHRIVPRTSTEARPISERRPRLQKRKRGLKSRVWEGLELRPVLIPGQREVMTGFV